LLQGKYNNVVAELKVLPQQNSFFLLF